jgi:hypothetical protein
MLQFIEYTRTISRMIKDKRNISMGDEKIVTFHFASGKTMDIYFSKKKLDEILESLKLNWKECNSIGPEWGINFSLVTHYEIKDKNSI